MIKSKGTSKTFDGADSTFEQCYEFLCQVRLGQKLKYSKRSHAKLFLFQLIESGAKVVRGPYLGRLELHHTMTELNENANELLGDFLELLVEYFRKVRNISLINQTLTLTNRSSYQFGDKPCCASDIILFLNFLEVERRAELASRLLEVCEISSTKLPQNVSSRNVPFKKKSSRHQTFFVKSSSSPDMAPLPACFMACFIYNF